MATRERWATRIGWILAAAGSAVGIGNFLRFPSQAAKNGGGAFIIPYLISLVLFAIPAMWVTWWVGRYGGRYGHSTTVGMFHRIARSPIAKYLGVMGVAFPLIFSIYYTYAESWMLGYAFLSLTGHYKHVTDFSVYFNEYQGVLATGNYFATPLIPWLMMALTLALNLWVLYRGAARGIELLAKIAMPLLFLFAIVMAVAVLTLEPARGTVLDGLAYIWSPDFSRLGTFSIWLAAAGQLFFSLSIGFGSLECYASYASGEKDQDIVLSGLTTASTNEFVEVIFGSLIAIPATAVFFGAAMVPELAGTFSIGMIAMPEVIREQLNVHFIGTIWFLLLFFAAFTSSVSTAEPVIAFFQSELGLDRKRAVTIVAGLWVLGTVPTVLFNRYGMVAQLDFWVGTLFLVVMAFVEVLLAGWVFGIDRYWEDIHRGADIRIPRLFYYITKYVTPLCLAVILGGFVWEEVRSGFPNVMPKPFIVEGVANLRDFPAKVFWEKDPEAEQKIDEALRSRVQAMKRDFRVIATLDVRDGKVQRIDIEQSQNADPDIQNWVRAKLEQRTYEMGGKPLSGTLRFQVDGYYVRPYVYLARVIVFGSYLLFALLVAFLWTRRWREG
jgi:NSS family neurotransmitter:Na+ symporter